MDTGRFGIWFIGAWGAIATTTAATLVALQNNLLCPAKLVSEEPRFLPVHLANWSRFVAVGGHEIRRTSLVVEAKQLFSNSSPFGAEELAVICPKLESFDRNVRTGTLINIDAAIASRAGTAALKTRGESLHRAISRLEADLAEFRKAHLLDHIIVVNVATPEPEIGKEIDASFIGQNWSQFSQNLAQVDQSPLPASTIYAIASLNSGCSYLNFTSSLGSDLSAVRDLARATGTLHMGREGKWCEASKSGGPILDVVRFTEREHRRGKAGVMAHLSDFFKSPMASENGKRIGQPENLERWLEDLASTV